MPFGSTASLLLLLLNATGGETPRVREEIVVTANRAPVVREELTTAATVVDKATIDATPGVSAAEVLQGVPGLIVFGGSSTIPATIVFRGFYGGGEVEYVQLLVDGVPTGDAESRLAQWQQFRAGAIERIEVARGMESALYGDAAVGGVVQLFTRRDEGWSVSAGRGSFDSTELAAMFSDGSVTVTADASSTDGDRTHSGARRLGARVRWSRELASTRLLTLTADHRRSDRDDPGPLPLTGLDSRDSDPLYANDDDLATRQHAAASLVANAWNASVHLATKDGEGTRTILLFPPSFADTTFRTIASREAGATFQLSRARWRAGADAATQRFEADYFDVKPQSLTAAEPQSSCEALQLCGFAATATPLAQVTASRNTLAVYATTTVPLTLNTSLTAGLRADAIRNRASATNPATHAWSPKLALHATLGQFAAYLGANSGFKAPTLEQLYDVRPLRAFGQSFTLANPDLVPQRARSLEAGLSRRTRHGLWQLDAYLTRVAHEIDFDPRTFRYENISRSEHRGVEAAFERRLSSMLVPRIAYTWMRVFSRDDASRAQLKNVPEHAASAMLTARLPFAIDASALYAWNGGRYYDDAAAVAAPDTHTLGLRLRRTFGSASLRLDLTNATNAHNAAQGFVLGDHAFAYPDARRTVRVFIDWNRAKERP